MAWMSRPVETIVLSPEDRLELERRVRAHGTPARDLLRARVILLRSENVKQVEVAAKLHVSKNCVNKWSRRFTRHGITGLHDAPGRGRKPRIAADKIDRIITQAVQPPSGSQRWSTRSMARAVGVSADTVHRLWSANDIKPHLIRTFKLSNDPEFEKKFWDVIGLYLNPPDRALVLCCDEKSQCQALERTQPGLPLGMGHIRTRTHDYVRHGTITLFAALAYVDGKLITRTEEKHTHVEWLRFLKQIDRQTPRELDLHLIVDNYGTHKHPAVRAWLAKHRRFHIHFTPTSSSWMNLVERFFADLTANVVREGSFSSVRELVADIETYLAKHNACPRTYRWRADGHAILEKIQRARRKLEEVKAG